MLPKPQSRGLFWYLSTEQFQFPKPTLAQTLLSSPHLVFKVPCAVQGFYHQYLTTFPAESGQAHSLYKLVLFSVSTSI